MIHDSDNDNDNDWTTNSQTLLDLHDQDAIFAPIRFIDLKSLYWRTRVSPSWEIRPMYECTYNDYSLAHQALLSL